ncbi:hypothetical protein EG68_12369 [Paragonimus skrjabini miyazakii]|uniref:Uncharacterized protein n=1 Tax=Paragonimus skrjabini miyazakii TaxID=59628 RepID=A0A8S9YTZ3_9TREM|nr:hypothetical protein EG68_12369 [Paragonimus skrjabini miyazakii]
MLQRAFYVGDCLMSVSNEKEMQAVALLLKLILIKSSFRLTKIYSSVKDAVTDMPKGTVAWEDWLHGLAELTELRIPRCYRPRTFEGPYQMELHGFSGGSEAGYRAAIYARLMYADGFVYCYLVFGMSRVVSIRVVSIPGMELTVAIHAAKLTNYIERGLLEEVKSVTLWTSLIIVVQFIRNTSNRVGTFVVNRLCNVHDVSSQDDWRYVDIKRNPADLNSRGMHPKAQRTGV